MIDAARLARVPGCEAGEPPRVVRVLPGGRGRNSVHYLETAAGRFVLRERLPPVDRPAASARQELHCHAVAAAAGLAPAIVDSADDGSWILMHWLGGRAWSDEDMRQPASIAALGSQLARLHALAPPAQVPPIAPVALAKAQRSLIEARRPDAAAWSRALLAQLDGLVREAGPVEHPVLCHGDLQMANCLGDPPRFVDWEYAQIADPTYDLACLLTYYPVLQAHEDVLLAAAGLDHPQHRAQLALQRRIFSILDRLWVLALAGDAG